MNTNDLHKFRTTSLKTLGAVMAAVAFCAFPAFADTPQTGDVITLTTPNGLSVEGWVEPGTPLSATAEPAHPHATYFRVFVNEDGTLNVRNSKNLWLGVDETGLIIADPRERERGAASFVMKPAGDDAFTLVANGAAVGVANDGSLTTGTNATPFTVAKVEWREPADNWPDYAKTDVDTPTAEGPVDKDPKRRGIPGVGEEGRNVPLEAKESIDIDAEG